ncbi:peptidase S9 [Sphingobacterium mizutaii NBRC 14946 = DSM 11724]|uniref:Prolyl tripeptidyl peptidase n=2 Tax=Sphingobacterium mizutaii TaxID=1010 RepID=A0AAJ5C0T5_9SPHI|nr:prolyl oligopeptidase family serine peptidase [Sphingobacterium mizutaii]GEM69317.1 peptidase S9 [Sphingobacterium mizutaii NBRC 14946 = DSM 11724]SDL13093.1 Dipeptidyl aminopeptidase/acylaminoacyl peptidase [Sphingobacterium mizutaii]SNV51874.1 Prolyl tripeptidyl peptidase precursor [Sphingobacterium mizutaii]
MHKINLIISCLVLGSVGSSFAQLSPLTVEKIMRDPKWMGTSPSNYRWSDNSRYLYFNWNPEGKDKSQVYRLDVASKKYELSSDSLAKLDEAPQYIFNQDKTLAVFEREGDIYVKNKEKVKRLTETIERENPLSFLLNDELVFQRNENVYTLDLNNNTVRQLTNFQRGVAPKAGQKLSDQDEWLKKDQEQLFEVFKEEDRLKDKTKKKENKKTLYLGDAYLGGLSVSPDGQFITYRLIYPAKGNRNTIVPDFITRSGYVEDLNMRTKVGNELTQFKSFVYKVKQDTALEVKASNIPGIKDLPAYLSDYPERLAELQKANKDRQVSWGVSSWSPNAKYAVITAKAQDNKDFWILKVNPEDASLVQLDRQHDDAWISGPGIGRDVKWLNEHTFYFNSEASGYSHLYSYDLNSNNKKQLTEGNWEVQSVQLSKDGKNFYISANKEHPGITHFYSLPVQGGNLVQITSMKGGNEVTLSPDEKYLAISHSTMNKPWELYLQNNKPQADASKITKSTTAEFDSYAWREPDMVKFQNRYGDDVYARVYPAKNPHPNKPAVVFVHGAGYLQNVHYWWSQYFREYMFNNMLADNGYTVIDIDYTASSGYGRNHRTGIYRHMGGKDLTDQVDGVKYLVDHYGVNPANVGLYGGSYGGFITLMGLFTEPDVFKSGAALRSVTDWAHYNHGYTANILNTPVEDPIAFKRSSPIYFADKLKGNLLMLHGMVDVNVQFQDIVRLNQRLIELGKENWDLAVYPVEDHGFVQPSSWTDEYKRIFKLFENTLKK